MSRILQQIKADSALLAASYSTIQNADSHILIPPVVTSQVENTVIPPTGHLMSQKSYFHCTLRVNWKTSKEVKLIRSCSVSANTFLQTVHVLSNAVLVWKEVH